MPDSEERKQKALRTKARPMASRPMQPEGARSGQRKGGDRARGGGGGGDERGAQRLENDVSARRVVLLNAVAAGVPTGRPYKSRPTTKKHDDALIDS